MSSSKDFKKIAIVKLSSLGDIIHTIPAFHLIRKKFPEAQITWFAEPAGSELLKNFNGIDRIEIIDLKKKTLFKKAGIVRNILKKFRRKFDLSVDFQGLLKSSILSFILGKERLGFNKKNLREPASKLFYTETANYFDEKRSVIKKNINLTRMMGIGAEEISYPLKELSRSDTLNEFIKKSNLKRKKYIVINIGAGWQSKLLTPEQYIKMTADLSSDFRTVILWGNGEEESRADHIVRMTGALKAPFLNFSDLIIFIREAKTLISSDSLPLHISDMVKTGTIGIFGPTSPERNGPINQNKLILYTEIECSNCYKRYCSHKKCLLDPDTSKIKEFIRSQ